jgi:CxxC motif-containing protein (DUF1111 family)
MTEAAPAMKHSPLTRDTSPRRLHTPLAVAAALILAGCGGGEAHAPSGGERVSAPLDAVFCPSTGVCSQDALVKPDGPVTAAAARVRAGSPRAPFWPAVDGAPVVQEWYSDIPWHQKLGTFAGNEIDEALVLPYDALGDAEKALCATRKLSPEDCMLELGVNNILSMLRTDTPYAAQDPKIQAAKECQDPLLPCIEVKLALSSFRTRSTGSAVALQPRPFGKEPPDANSYYGGYTVTDGSSYAPQMPWYLAHYCDSLFAKGVNDVQDPVCYGDYFSPMNNGFNPMGKGATDWPRSQPWSIFPATDNGPANHCKAGQTQCTMVMAGFDLRAVPPNAGDLQYGKYNGNLLNWFNAALKNFPSDAGPAELQRHFPWSGTPVTWESFLYPQAAANPFLGQFDFTTAAPANGPDCDVGVSGPTAANCFNTAIVRASGYLYPRRCTLADLASGNVQRLRQCGLNYEFHHNGYLEQWPESFWPDIKRAGMIANQYGRTSFLFGGIPGLQMPVSFHTLADSDANLSIYEQVHNASLFSLYLPIANTGDVKRAFSGRNYTDAEFFHTLLMSNHMESDPEQFAQGIRGKVLWHNEYRTQKMYEAFVNDASQKFGARTFAGAFEVQKARAPFHNNTCDGCHVRNGSGVPINPAGTLDKSLQEFMTAGTYNPYPVKDYTFTGQIRPMKLVFFDLRRDTTRLDSSRYSEPLSFPARLAAHPPRAVLAADLYYNNKVMNYHGDSFHATTPGNSFDWTYEPAGSNRLVVNAARVNAELNKTYEPRQIKLGPFQTGSSCQLLPPDPDARAWPGTCDEVGGAAISAAIANGEVGAMLLNGKRLGNLGAIEAIPNRAVVGFRDAQRALLGNLVAGEIIWNAGARDGLDGKVQKTCQTQSLLDCFIARFGWLGDRVSLEDQIANAAFVEMNMTTSDGYTKLYQSAKVPFPIRYAHPNCGAANKTCVESGGNGDLSELDIERMAAYARWLGNPTRPELKVTLPEVVAGEKAFRKASCDTCHVIRKIAIDPDDTMVSKPLRDRLASRVARSAGPFLSYIGTDLLMHDMGYLSQVADANQPIRDADGVLLPAFKNHVQKLRTPALKGLRLNRFVTDSHKNTKTAGDPACDFLLHDGRACDAIEAAFLHDGPAIKKLGVIDALNGLTARELLELRAFLYSL